ncbi:MAG: hypothetical protein U0270_32855 [Labilithrix sp.]
MLSLVALAGCSGPAPDAGSNESNQTEARTLNVIEGREYARCWFDVSGADANLSCTSTARGSDPLGVRVTVAVTCGPGFKTDLDIETGGTVVAGTVPANSFPCSMRMQVIPDLATKTMLGITSEASWWAALDLTSATDASAARPLAIGQPFDLWPVATIAALSKGGGFSLKANPYTHASDPYRVGLSGSRELVFAPSLAHFGELSYVVAPATGGPLAVHQHLDAQRAGESYERDTTLPGPGYWAVTDGGLRAATPEEIASHFGGATPKTVEPPPVEPTTPEEPTAPVDADPTCGGDGQRYCASTNTCDAGTRLDLTTDHCVACGDAGQTYCFVDPHGVTPGAGGTRCNAGTRLDLTTDHCVACGDAGQTYCFVDPHGVTPGVGGTRCNAGTRLDLTTDRCMACGAEGQTYCFVDPHGVTPGVGGTRCNAGLHVNPSTDRCVRE